MSDHPLPHNFRLWHLHINIDRLKRYPDNVSIYSFVVRQIKELYPISGLTTPTLPPPPSQYQPVPALQQPDFPSQQPTSAPPPPTLPPPHLYQPAPMHKQPDSPSQQPTSAPPHPTLSNPFYLSTSTTTQSASPPPPSSKQHQQQQILQPNLPANQLPGQPADSLLSPARQLHLPIFQPPNKPPAQPAQDLLLQPQLAPPTLLAVHLLLRPQLEVRQPPDKPIRPPRKPPAHPAQHLLLQPQLAPPTVLAAHLPVCHPTTTPVRQTEIQPTPPIPPFLVPFSSHLFPPDPRPQPPHLSLLPPILLNRFRAPPAIKRFTTPTTLQVRCTTTPEAFKTKLSSYNPSSNITFPDLHQLPLTLLSPHLPIAIMSFPIVAAAASLVPALPAIIKTKPAGPGGESNPALPNSNPSDRSGGQYQIRRALHYSPLCVPNFPLFPSSGATATRLPRNSVPASDFSTFRWDPGLRFSSRTPVAGVAASPPFNLLQSHPDRNHNFPPPGVSIPVFKPPLLLTISPFISAVISFSSHGSMVLTGISYFPSFLSFSIHLATKLPRPQHSVFLESFRFIFLGCQFATSSASSVFVSKISSCPAANLPRPQNFSCIHL